MTDSPSQALSFQKVSFRYRKDWIIREASFTLCKGDRVVVVGPNGGGKTTLVKLMLGFLKPTKGTVSLASSILRIGYVPQQIDIDRQFPATVEEVVLSGRLSRTSWHGHYQKSDRRIVSELLEAMDLSPLTKTSLSQLSGGERQRVLIARGFASEPELLLLDEPTSHVDSQREDQLYQLLLQQGREVTILVVSHDPGIISSVFDRVLCVDHHVDYHRIGELSSFLSDYKEKKKRLLAHHHGQPPKHLSLS